MVVPRENGALKFICETLVAIIPTGKHKIFLQSNTESGGNHAEIK